MINNNTTLYYIKNSLKYSYVNSKSRRNEKRVKKTFIDITREINKRKQNKKEKVK